MKALTFFFCVFFLFSCGKQEKKIPENILPQKELVSVLVDIHLVEASAGSKGLSGDSLLKYVRLQDEYVFVKHHISRKKYLESFNFYSQDPKLLEEVYAEVLNELSKKQAELSVIH